MTDTRTDDIGFRNSIHSLIASGAYDVALKECDGRLAARPSDSTAISEKAMLLTIPFHSEHSIDKAISILERALQADSESSELIFALGYVQEHGVNDYFAAAEAYRRVIAIDAENVDACLALARLAISSAPGADVRKAEALALLERAKAIASSNYQIRRELGRLYWELQQYDKAAEEYQMAISSTPPPDSYSAEQLEIWLSRVRQKMHFEKGYAIALSEMRNHPSWGKKTPIT